MTNNHTSLKKLPDTPGVYFFIGPKREVLYVGKATSLRSRVRSYFASDLVATRGKRIVQMVEHANRVEFRTTDSVLEALILEANLIKELKPSYNAFGKDDKSYNYLVITTDETWPRLLTVRGHELQAHIKELGSKSIPVYGPFVHAAQFKEALKLIRRIFPYFDTKHLVDQLAQKKDKKLTFNQTIGVYPPANTTPAEYARTIRHIRLFFDGRKKELVRRLERDMHTFAKKQQFEKAAQAKRQLFALRHLEDVSLIKHISKSASSDVETVRIEAYDVAHLQGTSMVGVMTVVEGGEPQKKEYRTFNIMGVTKTNDTAALKEVLERRLAHPEWPYPRLIVVDGGTAQLNAAKKVLTDAGIEIPVVAVTKDERHRPKVIRGPATYRTRYASDILLANSEAHRFSLARHRRKRSQTIK
jgi:excinuclease UvrABC nuclease subunit